METTTTTTDDDIDVAALGAWRPGAEAPHSVPPKLPESASAQEPAATIAPVKTRKGVRSALVWGGAGFMAGAVFWHVIGIGELVSTVAMQGTQETGAEFALADAPTASSFPKATDVPAMPTAPETAALQEAPGSDTAAVPAQSMPAKSAEAETAAVPAVPTTAQMPVVPEAGPAKSPEGGHDMAPAKAAASEAAAPNPQTVYMVDPANCTALVLDRPTKRTLVRPCPDGGLPLRLESAGGREDLAGLAPKLEPTRYSRE